MHSTPPAAGLSCHPVGDLSGSNVCAHCFLSRLLHAREIRWVRTKGGTCKGGGTSLCAWGLPHLPIHLRGGHARQRGGLQREICPPAHHSLAPFSSVCPSCVVGAAAVCECAWPQCWFFTNALAARSAVGLLRSPSATVPFGRTLAPARHDGRTLATRSATEPPPLGTIVRDASPLTETLALPLLAANTKTEQTRT